VSAPAPAPHRGRAPGALIAGIALGATAAGGTALLLYSGSGFLRAAGLLISSTIMALAAGLWAGAPEDDERVAPGPRWFALVIMLLIGGVFAGLWTARDTLRDHPVGGAAAVLLVLALPAYTAGALLAALHAREPDSRSGGVGAAAAAGGALGVLFAMSFLIRTLDANSLYYAAAVLVSVASLLDRGPATSRHNMRPHVAIITGVGSAGQLGFALAQRFLREGARVVITSRSESIHELAATLGTAHVAAVQADLLDDAALQRVLDTARDRFGGVDSVIHAAGGLTLIRDVAHTADDEWRAEMQRNAETTLRIARAALPLLRESRGAIVTFASPAGERAVARLGAYSAAKAAVIALTRALALEEMAHGVRANCIAPGMMDTDANRADAAEDARYVSRDDVASVAWFLATPASAGISGETIHVAGPTLG